MVLYVDAVVAVTVMRVLLYVCILRECDGDDNAGVGAVSACCEYMGGTRVSRFMSNVDDVQEMSVVRGVRGVGGVW